MSSGTLNSALAFNVEKICLDFDMLFLSLIAEFVFVVIFAGQNSVEVQDFIFTQRCYDH